MRSERDQLVHARFALQLSLRNAQTHGGIRWRACRRLSTRGLAGSAQTKKPQKPNPTRMRHERHRHRHRRESQAAASVAAFSADPRYDLA
jgi:hypothetical protein